MECASLFREVAHLCVPINACASCAVAIRSPGEQAVLQAKEVGHQAEAVLQKALGVFDQLGGGGLFDRAPARGQLDEWGVG